MHILKGPKPLTNTNCDEIQKKMQNNPSYCKCRLNSDIKILENQYNELCPGNDTYFFILVSAQLPGTPKILFCGKILKIVFCFKLFSQILLFFS